MTRDGLRPLPQPPAPWDLDALRMILCVVVWLASILSWVAFCFLAPPLAVFIGLALLVLFSMCNRR
jgi:hypothetical protein